MGYSTEISMLATVILLPVLTLTVSQTTPVIRMKGRESETRQTPPVIAAGRDVEARQTPPVIAAGREVEGRQTPPVIAAGRYVEARQKAPTVLFKGREADRRWHPACGGYCGRPLKGR